MGRADFGFAGTVIDWLATGCGRFSCSYSSARCSTAVILVVGLAIGVAQRRVFGWTNYRKRSSRIFPSNHVPYGKVDFVLSTGKNKGTDARA